MCYKTVRAIPFKNKGRGSRQKIKFQGGGVLQKLALVIPGLLPRELYMSLMELVMTISCSRRGVYENLPNFAQY